MYNNVPTPIKLIPAAALLIIIPIDINNIDTKYTNVINLICFVMAIIFSFLIFLFITIQSYHLKL